jgi:FixJ family two-component response regulator
MYQVMEPIRGGSEEINHNHVILVIDDDHAVRNSLKFTLEVEGFKVRAYSDPRELLNEGSLPPFSCLVIDYYLPEMNGLELVAELRDRHISIPTILITTLPNQDLRNRAKAAGIQIVEKPLLGSCLLDSIRMALDEHTKGHLEQ